MQVKHNEKTLSAILLNHTINLLVLIEKITELLRLFSTINRCLLLYRFQ